LKARSIFSRILLVVLATAMLVLSGTLAWAAVNDYQSRGYIPKGVTIAGKDVGGMTEAQARAAIEEAVSAPLSRPLTITSDRKTFTLDPKGIVTVDADSMIAEAYAPRKGATFVARLGSDLGGAQLPAQVAPKYTVNQQLIDAWVAKTAAAVNRPSTDAVRTIDTEKYKVTIKPATYGAKLDQPAASKLIVDTLMSDTAISGDNSQALNLATVRVKPHVVQSSFKNVIIVSLSECKIRLFNGAKLVKSYPCAPGQSGYPTPKGDFKVVTKLANSSWINPHADWSASMPEVIGPGPDNPMGVRKIGINFPGVFMHGIPPGEFGSIGTHASHGCMRMYPSDVLDLFGRVKLGDPVYIRD
jgi:lipoprotein-anchoring transpeptidase ErfK/SrfK